MDPSTLRLQFKCVNTTAAQQLLLQGGAHSLFSMVRLLIGGTEVERIEHYNRTHHLFRFVLQPPDWNVNQACEDGGAYDESLFPPVKPKPIAGNAYAMLSLQPMLGLLSCNRYIPLRYANGVVLEFTLASPDDALAAAPASASRTYNVEQAELRYSTVRLDSALEAGFASLLMQNRSLSMNFKTVISQTATIPAGATEFSASVVRALSRVAAVFVSFFGTADAVKHPLRFHNPSDEAAGVKTMQAKLQVGGKTWPEHAPIQSQAEAFSYLRQALNIYSSNEHAVSITPDQYDQDRFCLGFPTSIIPGTPFSSISTRSGDLLSVVCKNLDASSAARMQIAMVAEVILEISSGGTTLLE